MFHTQPPGRVYTPRAPGFLAFLRRLDLELVEDSNADTVLFGFDCRMTYETLSTAIAAVLDNGANLMAVHENHIFRDSEGNLSRAWVRAVEYATGKTATIVGKPSLTYYAAAVEKLGTQPA